MKVVVTGGAGFRALSITKFIRFAQVIWVLSSAATPMYIKDRKHDSGGGIL